MTAIGTIGNLTNGRVDATFSAKGQEGAGDVLTSDFGAELEEIGNFLDTAKGN